MDKETLEAICTALAEIKLSLADNFRHNKVVAPLQQWREQQLERLEECIKQLNALSAAPD